MDNYATLLAPIPGDDPGGADLRYDPLYDRIKELRREDDRRASRGDRGELFDHRLTAP
jgi:type VI secretion system protein ImpA